MSWSLDAWIFLGLASVLCVAFLVQIVVTRLSSLPIPLLKRHYHVIGLVSMALIMIRTPDLRGYDQRDPFDDPAEHLYATSQLTLIRRFHIFLFDYALGLFTYYTYSALHQHTSKTVPRILRRLLVIGWICTVVCLLSLDVAGTMLPQRHRHDPAFTAEIVVACSVTFFALTQVICYVRLNSSIRGYLVERRKGLAAAAEREAAANNSQQDATPSQGSSFSGAQQQQFPQFSPRNGHRKQQLSLALQASPSKPPHRGPRNNTEERRPGASPLTNSSGTQPIAEPEADAASAAAAVALLISMGITSRRGDICFPLEAPPRVLGGATSDTDQQDQGSSPQEHHRVLSEGQQDEAENSVAPLRSEGTFGGLSGGGGGGADGDLSARASVSIGTARGYHINHNLPLTGLNHSRHQQQSNGRDASFSTTAGAYLQTPALYATRGSSPLFDAEPSPSPSGQPNGSPKLTAFHLPAAAQPQGGVTEQSASLQPSVPSERVQLVNGSPFVPSPRTVGTRRDSHSTHRPLSTLFTNTVTIPEDESAQGSPTVPTVVVQASAAFVVTPATPGAPPTSLRLRMEEPATFSSSPRLGGPSSSPRHQHTQSLIVGPSSPKGLPPSPRSRAPTTVAAAAPALERKNTFGTSALLPLPQTDSPHGSFRLVAQPANAVNKLRHVLGVAAPTFSTTGAARAAETRALERRMLKIAVFFGLSLAAQSLLFIGVVANLVNQDSGQPIDPPWIRLIESMVLGCGCLLLWYSNVVNSATLKTCALAHWNWNPFDSRLPNAARRVRDMTELAFLPSNGTTMTAGALQLRAATLHGSTTMHPHARHASRAMILDEDMLQRERSVVGGGGSRNYRGSLPSPARPVRSESLFFTPGTGAANFASPTEFATVSEMRLPAGLMPPTTPDMKALAVPATVAVQWMPALERIVTMDSDTANTNGSGRTLRHEATTDRTLPGGAMAESDDESQTGSAREKLQQPPPPRVTLHTRVDSLEEIPCADTSTAAIAAASGHISRSPLDIFEDAGFHRPAPMQLRDSELAAVNTRAFGDAESNGCGEMVVAFTATTDSPATSPKNASAATTVPPAAAQKASSPGKSVFRLQVQRPLAASTAGSLAVPSSAAAASDSGSLQAGADTPGSSQRGRFQIKIRPHAAATSPVASPVAATTPPSETLTVIAPQPSRIHRINLRVNPSAPDASSGPAADAAPAPAPAPPRDSHLEAPPASSRASPRLGVDDRVRRGSDSTNGAPAGNGKGEPAGRTSHSTSRSANAPGPGFRITVDAENPLDASEDTTNPLSHDDYELSIGSGARPTSQHHTPRHAQHFSLEFPVSPFTVGNSPSMVGAAGGSVPPLLSDSAHLLSPKSYQAHRDRESRFSFSNQTNATLLLPPGAAGHFDASSGLHSSGPAGLNSFRSALRAATAAVGAHHLSLGDHDGLGARSALSSPTPDPLAQQRDRDGRGQGGGGNGGGHYDIEKSTHVSSIHLHSHRGSHARHHRHANSGGGSGEHSLLHADMDHHKDGQ